MGNDQNSHRNAVTIFAVALIVVLIVAFITTFRGVDTTRATNEAPPGPSSPASRQSAGRAFS